MEDSFNDSVRWQKQTSHGQPQMSSLRSSPDLGVTDIDHQSGLLEVAQQDLYQKSSRESLLSSPEAEQVHPRGLQNLTLDGDSIQSGRAFQRRGEELPFTRLSSLHDMSLNEQSKVTKAWVPNKDALELIMAMGISENAAKRGLYHTGNDNAEVAVGWVFENISNPELHEPFNPSISPLVPGDVSGAVYHSFDEVVEGTFQLEHKEGYKMVFVANSRLGMGVGKLAAQVGHAVLALYRYLESHQDQMAGLREWESRGAKKVVLRGNNTQHLLDLKQKALELHLANILVHDAGRTQIDPGSLTVLGLFGLGKEVDIVTGKLKLL